MLLVGGINGRLKFSSASSIPAQFLCTLEERMNDGYIADVNE
jgi:hypothetical protein